MCPAAAHCYNGGMWPFGNKEKKRRVLLVDDDVAARTMLGMFFDEIGWEVREASNGREGADAATSAPPDLILLDFDMPVMTGPDALVMIRANPKTKAVPILMVTARATLDDVDDCLARGATDYVSKPVDLMRLKAKVEQLVPAPK